MRLGGPIPGSPSPVKDLTRPGAACLSRESGIELVPEITSTLPPGLPLVFGQSGKGSVDQNDQIGLLYRHGISRLVGDQVDSRCWTAAERSWELADSAVWSWASRVSHRDSSSVTFATIRFCSASGGRGDLSVRE